MTTLMWLLVATGFMGALTLRYLGRVVSRIWHTPFSAEVHFSPKGGCTETVVRELGTARHLIQVLAYSFTSKPIAQALVDAKLRGVHVEIVLDHSNETEAYTDLHFFLEQGLMPLIDAKHAIAHNKVMIVDNRTLITGSFNFTHNAEADNAENLLVLRGHPELLKAYRQNFADHKAHAREAQPKAQPRPQAAAHPAEQRKAA